MSEKEIAIELLKLAIKVLDEEEETVFDEMDDTINKFFMGWIGDGKGKDVE